MAVVVVDESEFGVVVFAGPLDGLGKTAFCRYLSIGGVSIGGADVAGGAVDFADILGEVPAIGMPGTVFLDCQRAGGDGLGGIPGNKPHTGMVRAGQVKTSDL